MAILSNKEAKRILTKVMKFSKADGCEANLTGTVGGNSFTVILDGIDIF